MDRKRSCRIGGMIRNGWLPSLMLALCGCTTVQDVPEGIEYSEIISGFRFSCAQPYELVIGCNAIRAVSIPYEVEGRSLRMSSTQDGKVLLVSNDVGSELASSVVESYTFLLLDPSARELGKAIPLLVEELGALGIRVVDIKVLSTLGNLYGYILVTDGDALSALGLRSGPV